MNLLKSLECAVSDYFSHEPKSQSVSERHRVVFYAGQTAKFLEKLLKKKLAVWQMQALLDSTKDKVAVQKFNFENETLWVLQLALIDASVETVGHENKLKPSSYAKARDLAGAWLRLNKPKGHISFEFYGASQSEQLGAIVGLGIASYQFLDAVKDLKATQARSWDFTLQGQKKIDKDLLREAYALYSGINASRHLTNLPASVVDPQSLAHALPLFFKKHKGLKVTVWDENKLKQEGMGLLLGVGQGSQTGSRLIHLKYRPLKKSTKKSRPLAFVGKGVTFDTGGLDLKPASGMRLMKKDMAGSASMVGLAHLCSVLQLRTPADFYLPLAENAVSEKATRPGDVHAARNKMLVEIDNTDAEGRLVMADAFDVAVDKEGAEKPEALFDLSTLTGAMRVAVGLDVAGYFSNHDKYAREVEVAAVDYGEAIWRMPLLQKYRKMLSTPFADMKNSSDSGFAGAIIAALFLEKFTRNTPWVHFDMMAWSNSADGAFSEGANAQGFQVLAGLLLNRE